jgi:hypothetical protein
MSPDLEGILPRPKIEEIEEKVVIRDVVSSVNFDEGGALRFHVRLAKACLTFGDLEASVENLTDSELSGKRFPCKSPLSLIYSFCAFPATRFNIYVTPISPKAEELALMIYSSFTDENWENAGVNRYG